jgi:Asp-tRNA(Asn)/Glu-tRNA(Gln) amidotransferase A subunit family amidase
MYNLGQPVVESPGLEILKAIASGRTTVSETANVHLDTIRQIDTDIRAFVHLDPDAVRTAAHELDRGGSETCATPLLGLPIAIKDLIDTYDQPAEYGSRLFSGHRPSSDAAVVRNLRKAGALIIGKTVTTEFALFSPGATRNPRDLQRTPGGSSSGSAAAVAAGMVPVALGTQTAGSIIRPASFCGIVGFKPTFGTIDRGGVFPISETLDTVGILSRSVADTAAVFDVVRTDVSRHENHRSTTGGPESNATIIRKPLRLGFARPIEWGQADDTTRTAIDALKRRLPDSGVDVVEITLPAVYDGLTAAQTVIMNFEVSRSLSSRCEKNPALVSPSLKEVLRRGAAISGKDYSHALDLADKCRAMLPDVFGTLDALAVPAVIGEAPMGTQATGDPVFCRPWTLLHCPAISLPLLQGPSGLPIGIQVVGNLNSDDKLLETAQALMASVLALSQEHPKAFSKSG